MSEAVAAAMEGDGGYAVTGFNMRAEREEGHIDEEVSVAAYLHVCARKHAHTECACCFVYVCACMCACMCGYAFTSPGVLACTCTEPCKT